MLVAVGSRNPVKIESVRLAFEAVWPDISWDVEGCSVPSSAPDQPMSDDEALRGARSRATGSLEALGAAYGVGLEGGVQQVEDQWFNCGWVSVVDREGREGIGTTLRMVVPPALMKIVLAGRELGEACDMVFRVSNTKQVNGLFGLMTNNTVHRTGAFRDGVVAALAGFLHPELMSW